MKKFIILFCLAIFASCNQEVEEIPINILSIDKMSEIMTDIQLIEGGMAIMKFNKDKDREEIIKYYRSLYKAHEIDKPLFDRSLQYYCKRPELFVEIYDGVINRLSEIQAEVGNKKE